MNNKQTLLPLLLCSFIALPTPAIAQITPDNTLGAENSRLTPNVLINGANADKIEGGAQRGSNLFHSFSQFNIDDGQRVYFGNPNGVENILTRVTGGNTSNIFGTLGVDGAANLFLINPNGILFGQNASLDIRGSFVGTTANAVQFGNQDFSATNPQAPPLLTVQPSGLLFNQINQNAAIQNNSIAPAGVDPAGFDAVGLRVSDGKSLLLVGGNVNMDGGQLNAYGGRVELGGLAAPGNINLLYDEDNLKLGFPENVTRADVLLTNQAFVYVEGNGGGDIAINARNLGILEESQLSAGIGQGLGTSETVAGDITLNATDFIALDGFPSDGFPSGLFNIVRSQAQGNAGNIDITTGSLSLTNGAQIKSSTRGQGNAGKIFITARDQLFLFGQGRSAIQNDVDFGGVGNSGGISINTGSLFLSDLAVITSNVDGRRNSGGISIVARDLVSLEQPGELSQGGGQPQTLIVSPVNDTGEGNSGDINIKTGSLRISNSQINTSTSGKGNSGDVIVEARDEVALLRGGDIFTEVTCACETENENGGDGKGGDIRITTGSLLLDSGSNLRADTEAKGDAGNIIINARDSITFSGSSEEFTSGAFSQVESEAVGRGGDIIINTGNLSLSGDQEINTRTQGQGDAGNVTINALDTVSLAGNAYIFSSVEAGGTGKGGNINITATTLSLTDGTQLIASTSGIGNAGNVKVNALDTVSLADSAYILSTVEAGGVGKGGNIDINAVTLSLTDGAQLLTLTRGASDIDTQPPGIGDAGNVNVKVTGSIDIAGENNGTASGIYSVADTGTKGNAGDITIDSGSFLLRNGALINARTKNDDLGGNITVNTDIFEALNGGQLIATTSSNGSAGKITVNASEKAIVSGSDPNYNDRITNFPDRVRNIGPNSGFFVSSFGSGNTGDIEINSPQVTLNNQGIFNAESVSGNGGNINVNSDLLLLRRGSQISTTAGTEQAGGNGGNITINSPLIVAVPKENSDIIANAFSGAGGNINIRTQGIFGIEARAKPSDRTNDITASSELGVQGQVNIIQPDVQPTEGLIELPDQIVDASDRIGQNCPRGRNGKRLGEFVVSGRGSLPPNSLQPLNGTTTIAPLATLDGDLPNISSAPIAIPSPPHNDRRGTRLGENC